MGVLLTTSNVGSLIAVQSQPNPDQPKGALNVSVALTKSASDTSKVVKFLNYGCKAFNEAQLLRGEKPSLLAAEASKTFGTAYNVLGVTRLPVVTRDAKEALSGGMGNSGREGLKKARDITDCIAAWLYAANLFLKANVLDLANIFSFTSDAANLPVVAGDAQVAQGMVDRANKAKMSPAELARVEDTRTLAFLNMIKTAASVVAGALTMITLAFGVTVVSGSVALGIGLTGASVALYAAYFEKTRDQKMIDLERVRNAIVTKQACVV